MFTVMPKKQLQLLILISVVGALFILLYSVQLKSDGYNNDTPAATLPTVSTAKQQPNVGQSEPGLDICPAVSQYPAEIQTNLIFPTLDLNPSWVSRREFWSNAYEDRYTRRRQMWSQLPLKVILMPHSHTDPGWLKTVEEYFATSTKNIITNVVQKLTQLPNMTFILSETSYVMRWWEQADEESRQNMRALLESGRLEITTGGWVMTDEANVDFFSMVDQLVEGHEFMRRVLNVKPLNSWSVDSFGHGSAFPHLLGLSEIKNMVIMRIHYIWKEWMARNQNGDFLWKQNWEKDGSSAPLCHNFPYDIYSIKHSCGPDPQTCLAFDFRHIDGEYNEFSLHYNPVHTGNIQSRAELLLDQYGRTGSLLPHNVVLVPLGDDFRYDKSIEFDQQYSNYMQIMQFINKGNYDAEISFGTLKDYFREVRNRMDKFPTLSGDFHVYSDIFSEGRPAYWSGYYFTRPYMKLLGRQVASKLKSVEIFYSLCLAIAQSGQMHLPLAVLTSLYPKLEVARRALALFQHHDAITGTSKELVMNDYESRLNLAVNNLNLMEQVVAQFLTHEDPSEIRINNPMQHTNIRNKGEDDKDSLLLKLGDSGSKKLVLLNSEAKIVQKLVNFRSESEEVCVYDSNNSSLDIQIFPTHNITGHSKLDTSQFQVYLLAVLPPVSTSVYRIETCSPLPPTDDQQTVSSRPTRVYCMRCPEGIKPVGSRVELRNIPEGAILLENRIYKLYFHSETKLLQSVVNKIQGDTHEVNLEFGAYISSIFRSGAYLFSVENVDDIPTEDPVVTAADIDDLIIVSGPLFSEIHVVWEVAGQRAASKLVHSVRLTHDTGPLSEAIHIQNSLDFGPIQNLMDREMFMRFKTDIKNGESEHTMFTDNAGLGMVERIYSEQTGVPGNLFPVTESVFIQDSKSRLTLLVDHATGASSHKQGWLEVMLDKRTMHDDSRGMGEGVLDSRLTKHRYVLMLEPKRVILDVNNGGSEEELSGGMAHISNVGVVLSRYLENPVTSLVWTDDATAHQISQSVELTSELPCGYELVNLRSWVPGPSTHTPTSKPVSALLLMRRLAPDCGWISLTTTDCLESTMDNFTFSKLNPVFRQVSLTANFPVNPTATWSQALPINQYSPMQINAYNVTFHQNP